MISFFNRLSKEVLRSIVDIRLEEVQERLVDKRITLNLTDAAKDWLTENGYDSLYGARPLNRLIQKRLLNPMAIYMLKGQIRNNETVTVDVKDGELDIIPNRTESEANESADTSSAEEKKPSSKKAEIIDDGNETV
uniref:Heat shock protein 78, mitochondrial n=1 Tax=Anoplophora glabripennis TaxID=217634 RepID=V5GYC0_ANOGL